MNIKTEKEYYTAETLVSVDLDWAESLYQALRKLPNDILAKIPHDPKYNSYLDEVDKFIREAERFLDDSRVDSWCQLGWHTIVIPEMLFKYVRFFREEGWLCHEVIS